MKICCRSSANWQVSAVPPFVVLVAVALTASTGCETTADAAGYDPGSPCTYLFDTGASAAEPLPAAAVAAKKDWKVLAEDDTTHKFVGDTVLLNDRLVLVLRGKAAGAELYAQGPSGPVRRAAIIPVGPGGGLAKLSAVRILENNPGAVMVEAGFQTAGGVARLTFRLTTGQAILELRPGEGAEKVRIDAPSRYVAVPDFFGDDMIFAADRVASPRLRLPAENFLLHFVDPGECLLMCVWPSSRQQATALVGACEKTGTGTSPDASLPGSARGGSEPVPVFSQALSGERAQRIIEGSEIDCAAGKSLWIGVLEGPGLWHAQPVSAADAPREMVLDWKPPFPAKWRATLAGTSAIGPSWYFRGAEDADEPAAASGERSPCCLEAGRALFQVPAAAPGTASRAPASLVIYPIDRSRTTPLTTFCPIDILRATLGVGPCQYILQTEGLASDANPTPDNVMTFVEKQFAKKKETQSADEMRQMLAEMVGHVDHAHGRIQRYAALARDVRTICQSQSASGITVRATEAFRPTLDALDRGLAGAMSEPAPRARKLVDEVLGLIGKPDALAECRRLGLELRRLGASQDRALASGRMAARWLRQEALAMAEGSPGSADLAAKVQSRVEETLGQREKRPRPNGQGPGT